MTVSRISPRWWRARSPSASSVSRPLKPSANAPRSADSLALEIEHRRRIERHQNLLLDELNHRVKNTLATVQAMAMQTLKGVDLQRPRRVPGAAVRAVQPARSSDPGQLGRRVL